MVSIVRLKRPCPCGSGKQYGDCCAPRNKTRKRKKPKKPKKQEHRPQPFSFGSENMVRLSDFITRFSGRFADAYNRASDFLYDRQGEEAFQDLFEYLEVVPSGQPSIGVSFILRSFAIFRGERSLGDEMARRLRTHVGAREGERAANTFEQMEGAKFGAWRVERSRRQITARRIDGSGESDLHELDLFTDYKWDAVDGDGVFVGWFVEEEDIRLLFFAVALPQEALRALEQAADRTPWGQGETFRTADYEEDIVSLLLRPGCHDTERNEGRVFLSPQVEASWYLRRERFEEEVGEALWRFGFRSPLLIQSDALREEGWSSYEYCESCEAYHPISELPPSWSVDAAMLASERPEEIIAQLQAMRAEVVPRWGWSIEPVGPRTLEYVLPTEAMLEMIELGPEAEVDHEKLDRAEQYPLAALDIDADTLRRAGFDLSWSIAQARSWAKKHASEELRSELDQAVRRHRTAMRWVSIVDHHRHVDDPAAGPVAYWQLMEGLRELLPPAALQTPLSELEDTGRGTWKRIEAAMRNYDMLDEPVLRLAHLPDGMEQIYNLSGVGEVSCDRLTEGLTRFVAQWPESDGHYPVSAGASASGEAAEELSAGLDELDELF